MNQEQKENLIPWVATNFPDFGFNRQSQFNTVIRALQHICKEDLSHRNKKTLETLNDLKALYPAIVSALNEERDGIVDWIDSSSHHLAMHGLHPATATLGEYWFTLLGKPEFFNCPYGRLKIILRPESGGTIDYETGESYEVNSTWASVEDQEYAARKDRLKAQYGR